MLKKKKRKCELIKVELAYGLVQTLCWHKGEREELATNFIRDN